MHTCMPRAVVLMWRRPSPTPRRTSSIHSGLNPAFASTFAAGSSLPYTFALVFGRGWPLPAKLSNSPSLMAWRIRWFYSPKVQDHVTTTVFALPLQQVCSERDSSDCENSTHCKDLECSLRGDAAVFSQTSLGLLLVIPGRLGQRRARPHVVALLWL